MRLDTQRRLVEMIRAGMVEKDIKQADIARKVGTSQGMISSAFCCNQPMRDERWRMYGGSLCIFADGRMNQRSRCHGKCHHQM